MLNVQTDADPRTAIISIDALADTTIDKIVYTIAPDPAKAFSVVDLNKSKATIIKKGPVAVLEISAKSVSKNNLVLSVIYLYKYSIFGSDRRTKKLQMYYVTPTDLYETRDLDTNKVVLNAYAYVRYDSGGNAAGIDRIETW